MRRFLVRLFALIGLLTVAGFVVGVIGAVMQDDVPEVPADAVLTLDLRASTAQKPPGPLAALVDGPLGPAAVQEALESAADDPRIKGVVARVDGQGRGPQFTAAVHSGMRAVRQAGKPSFAYATSFGEMADGTRGYELATAFEEIWVQPAGFVGLTGLASDVPFFGDLLKALGIEARFTHREEFKTAVANFDNAEMSAPHRRMLESLFGDLFDQLVARIAERRELEASAVRAAIDAAPLTASQAQERGLIDRVGHQDALRNRALVAAGDGAQRFPLEKYYTAIQADRSVADQPKIALIDGEGPIIRGASETDPLSGNVALGADSFAGAVEAALNDGVDGLLIRLDTPGGSAVASERARHALVRAREAGLPVAVAMGDTAASGGYWIASAADHIVARPATLTGSIGVVAGKFDTSGFWANLDVNWEQIKRGRNAGMLSSVRDFSASQRARLENLVDHTYNVFIERVAKGRDLKPAQVRKVAGGRVWTGRQAKQRGLVDSLGGTHRAVAWLKNELGVAKDRPIRVAPYPAPRDFLARLMDLLRGQGPLSRGLARYGSLLQALLGDGALSLAPGTHTARLPHDLAR